MKAVKAGIIVALPSESNVLPGPWLSRLEENRTVRTRTTAEGTQLLCVIAGMGRENARSAAKWLIGQGVSFLVSTGVGGGLQPGLKSGDLVIADSILSNKRSRQIEKCQTDLHRASLAHALLVGKGMSVYRGPMASISRPALDSRTKDALFGRTQALAVDMESAAIARAAREANIAFFVLRAICDPVGYSVHPDLPALIGKDGGLQLSLLFRMLFRNPFRASDLMSMRKCYNGAISSLEAAWQVLIQYGIFGETIPSIHMENSGGSKSFFIPGALRKRKGPAWK